MFFKRKRKKQSGGGAGLALLLTIGFVWLAHHSLDRHAEASYSHSVFKVLDHASKPMGQAKRQAIMQIWNISEEDLAKPVDLFGEN